MNDVDILIPTLRRPDHLARALSSAFAQTGAFELLACIVVVDNSPEASARMTVEALRAASPSPLVYVHAPKPGVATARNAGLAASHASLVAFLDDDEEAPPHWLSSLRSAHLALGAAVTFGPVRGVAVDAHPDLRDYLDGFFSREGGARTELIEEPFGCGNSMMTRALALAGSAPFDVRSDRTGGEDDRLFARLREEGLRFGWAPEAWLYEHAPASRSTLRYALKRAFCYGQGPSQTAVRARRWGLLAVTMAIGSAQASVNGFSAFALFVARRPRLAITRLDRAARGLGKVMWPVKVKLYGVATAPPPTDTQPGANRAYRQPPMPRPLPRS